MGMAEGGDRHTHIYLELICFAVWQKPTQHCKAVILQFKSQKWKKERGEGLRQRMVTLQEKSLVQFGAREHLSLTRVSKARVQVSSPTRLPSRFLFGESQVVFWVLTTYSTKEQPKDTWGSRQQSDSACDLGICPDHLL